MLENDERAKAFVGNGLHIASATMSAAIADYCRQNDIDRKQAFSALLDPVNWKDSEHWHTPYFYNHVLYFKSLAIAEVFDKCLAENFFSFLNTNVLGREVCDDGDGPALMFQTAEKLDYSTCWDMVIVANHFSPNIRHDTSHAWYMAQCEKEILSCQNPFVSD